MSRWPITLITDEAASSAAEQIAFIGDEGLAALDLRNANGRNVLDLTDEDIAEFEGVPIQCLASPINKVEWSEGGAQAALEQLRTACGLAHRLGTRRIRIFSPITQDVDLVREWMAPQVALAEAEDVVLLHENDSRCFGAYPEGARRLLAEFDCPHFRFAFDFANTVLLGFLPWDEWLPWLLPHIDTLHVKDAVKGSGEIRPAGQGDGQIVRTLKRLKEEGWMGTLTLEPHLSRAEEFRGFSGPELCRQAHRALLECLQEAGA
jgi:sugar phosphate isomerase/epimerase